MPSLMAVLGANIGPFISELNRAKNEAKSHGQDIGESFLSNLSQKLAAFASVGALEQVIHAAVEYGSKVNDLSNRLGMSVEAVQEWDYALKQTGGAGTEFVSFFEKLAVARDKALKGNQDMAASFLKLGVSMEALKTSRLEDIGEMIAHGFKDADPQQLIAALKEVGGRGAGEMIAMFKDGFRELAEEANKFTMTQRTVEELDRIGDAFGRMKAETIGLFGTITATIAGIGEGFNDMVRVASGFIVGAVSGLGEKMSSTFNPVAWVEGMIGGAVGTAKQALVKLEQESDERAKKSVEKAKARDKPVLSEEESKETKTARERAKEEAARVHMAHMERLAKLEEDNRKKEEAATVRKLTAAQQVLELEKQRAALVQNQNRLGEGTEAFEEERSKILDKDKEIFEAGQKAKQEEAAAKKKEVAGHTLKAIGVDANALQKMGGFLGGYSADPQVVLVDIQKRSERHLDIIRRHIERKKQSVSDDDLLF